MVIPCHVNDFSISVLRNKNFSLCRGINVQLMISVCTLRGSSICACYSCCCRCSCSCSALIATRLSFSAATNELRIITRYCNQASSLYLSFPPYHSLPFFSLTRKGGKRDEAHANSRRPAVA